jgi:hypothetical protein
VVPSVTLKSVFCEALKLTRGPSSFIVVFDGETCRKFRGHLRIRFADFLDDGVLRTLPQFSKQSVQLRGRTHGIDLDAAVGKIANIAGNADLLGETMDKIAIPDALDAARNMNALRLLLIGHGLRNIAASGREPAILPEVATLATRKAILRAIWDWPKPAGPAPTLCDTL